MGLSIRTAACLVAFSIVVPLAAVPIGTTFSYQGFLKDAGAPASGRFDFKFNLLDDSDPLIASELATTTVLDVEVVDGLFITSVDFGDVFDGSAVWLEIEVRPAGFGGLTTLYPPHPLHAVPYAVESSRLDGLAASDLVTGECYETDWGDRSACGFGADALHPIPVPTCNPGYRFMGLAQIAIANTDCNNWMANVRLRSRSICCRIP